MAYQACNIETRKNLHLLYPLDIANILGEVANKTIEATYPSLALNTPPYKLYTTTESI